MRAVQALMVMAAVAAVPFAATAQQGKEAPKQKILIARPGWLGIGYAISATSINGNRTESLTINEVVPNSPAAKAGLKKGERVVRIDGDAFSLQGFDRIARGMKAGDSVRLRVSNGTSERDVTLVAEERPVQFFAYTPDAHNTINDSVQRRIRVYLDSARIGAGNVFRMRPLHDSLFAERFKMLEPFPFDSTFPGGRFRVMVDSIFGDNFTFEFGEPMDGIFGRIERIGMNAIAGAEFEPINEGLAHYFGTDKGLLVLRVLPETPAARAGLEPGDVVIRAGGREVNDIATLRSTLIRPGTSVPIEVLRRGKNVKLEIGARRD